MGRLGPTGGISDADLYNLLQALVTGIHGFPNLRVGTTTTRIQTSAFTFRIDGQVYTKAAEDNVQVTGLTNTSTTQTRKVRVEINTAGTLSFKEGGPAAAQVNAPLPRRTASRATVGWIEIPVSFTYGTTLFSASGVAFFNGDPDLGPGTGLPPNDRGISATVLTG